MRGIIFLGVLGLVILSAGVAAGADVTRATIERLCEQVRSRKMLLVDRSKPEVTWSDGAVIEVARSFPAELEQLLSAPTMTRDLQAMITRFTPDASPDSGWQDARVVRSDRDQNRTVIESADGKITTHIGSPYFDYLHERYPRAQLRIKTAADPVVFLMEGSFRACIMPLAMPKPAGESP